MNTRRRPRVLIVDCHEEVLITFERLLEDEGYDTTTTWTGHDALAPAKEKMFDLVLVNEYLPDMNAEDFMRELQRRDNTVPCIVMQPSATQITDTKRFLAAGAVAVVCKWSPAKVLEAVHRHALPISARRREAIA